MNPNTKHLKKVSHYQENPYGPKRGGGKYKPKKVRPHTATRLDRAREEMVRLLGGRPVGKESLGGCKVDAELALTLMDNFAGAEANRVTKEAEDRAARKYEWRIVELQSTVSMGRGRTAYLESQVTYLQTRLAELQAQLDRRAVPVPIVTDGRRFRDEHL